MLHHTPDVEGSVAEVHCVLRPGGTARLMLYHYPSWTGLWIWARQCLLKGNLRSPRWAVAHHLESPGTQSYTVIEVRELLGAFRNVEVTIQVMHGDTLSIEPGHRYQSRLDRALMTYGAPALRALIPRFGKRFGHALLINATK